MSYWTDIFTLETWAQAEQHGWNVSGFPPPTKARGGYGDRTFGRIRVGDVFLCYLPLYHTFGRFLEMLGCVFWGASYCFLDNPSAMQKLASGEIAAVMRQVGKPIDVFAKMPKDSPYHFVPIPFSSMIESTLTVCWLYGLLTDDVA